MKIKKDVLIMQPIELKADRETLENYQDLQLLREAKRERANDPLVSFEDMKKEFSA
jgi:hypothetical protein